MNELNSSPFLRATAELKKLICELKDSNQNALPAETDLAKSLNLSRNTIRRAFAELEKDGIVERIRGKGTFIGHNIKEVSFSNWVGAELSVDRFLHKLIEDYRREHQTVQVNNITIPYSIYPQKVLDMILHGKAPDVIQLTPFWLRRFQQLNMFIPLSNFISQNIVKRRYITAFNLGRIGDEIYSLNWALCPLVLYYNKVVLEKAGLDPDKPPQSLEELAEMSILVSQGNNVNIYGLCLPLELQEFSFMCLYPFFLSFKGGFVDPIGNIIVDCEENIKALAWLSEFYEKGGVKKESDINGIRMLFASDQLAFMIDGPYGRGHLRQLSGLGNEFDAHYGITTIPFGPSGNSESVLLSHSLAISRQSKNPDLAYKWIEFLSTDEENAKFYFKEFGMIPCNRDVLHKPFFLADTFASVLIKQMESASMGPIEHPLFFKSLPFLLPAISKVLLYKEDPGKSLKFVREIINMIGQAGALIFPWT